MRHFILASHGYLAKGMAGSVKMILGERADVSFYCAYVDGNEHVKKEILERTSGFEKGAETVILTDIFGGSVNNELLGLVERGDVYLVSGMNLALVVELLIRAKDQTDTKTMIEESIKSARNNMKFCNEELVDGSRGFGLDEF